MASRNKCLFISILTALCLTIFIHRSAVLSNTIQLRSLISRQPSTRGRLPDYQPTQHYSWRDYTDIHPSNKPGVAHRNVLGKKAKLYNESIGKQQRMEHYPWRVYGHLSLSNDGLARRKVLGKKIELFNESKVNSDTKTMIKQLYSLPISCSERPESHHNYMSEKYGKFLEALAKYSSFHSQNRGIENSRKLIWDCAESNCGGLGDRIRGLGYTLILAMASQRVLLVHWRDSRLNQDTYLIPNVIDWRLNTNETKRLLNKRNHILPNNRETNNSVTYFDIGSKGLIGLGLRSTSSDMTLKSYYEAIGSDRLWIALETNMFLCSLVHGKMATSVQWLQKGVTTTMGLDKLEDHEINNMFGIVFRYLFNFSDEMTHIIDDARQVLRLSDLMYVGVHVRTSFAGSTQNDNNNLKHKPEVWNYILDCGYHTTLSLQTSNDRVIMFLATDSHTYKKTAFIKYNKRVRALNDSLIHIDHVKLKKVTDYALEGVKSMWVELVLLAEAHSLVMPKLSGFSFLAGSLCLIPRHRVLSGETCDTLKYLS